MSSSVAVEAVGPEMRAGRRIDELAGDPHPLARLAHAAFEHVAHAQLAPDLLHVDRPALVGEAGVARDHEQPAHARERGDDLLDDRRRRSTPAPDRRSGSRTAGRRSTVCRAAAACGRGAAPSSREPVDADGFGDVLEPLLAARLESQARPSADLLHHPPGDADAARLRELLQPCGDVHRIAMPVLALDDDVADMRAQGALVSAISRIDPRSGPLRGLTQSGRTAQAKRVFEHVLVSLIVCGPQPQKIRYL